MLNRKLLLKFCVFYFAAFKLAAGNSSNVTSITCPYKPAKRKCDLCVAAAKDSVSTETEASKLLESYLKYQQIIIQDDGDKFIFYFHKRTVLEYRHIVITFYAWDEANSTFGRPIQGCCRFPLVATSCYPDDVVSGNVYYTLTLFRTSVVRYYKHYKPPPPPQKQESQLDGRYHQLDRPKEFMDVIYSEAKHSPPPPSTWLNYTRYVVAELYSYVCVFSLDKEIVLRNKTAYGDSDVESYLFKRGVYKVAGYFYDDDTIYSEITHEEVECTSKTFQGTSVYSLSASDSNNDTFTCLILWFSLNDLNRFDVKCMPHNATYIEPTTVAIPNKTLAFFAVTNPPPRIPTKQEDLLVIILCSIAGFLVLLLIVTVFFCNKKAIKNVIKTTREVPDTLNVVMSAAKTTPFDYDEKMVIEKVTSFDEAEKLRIVEIYKRINQARKATRGSYSTNNMKQFISMQLFTMENNMDTSKGASEDSGISSGISSGGFPLSEADSDFTDRDIYNPVFEDDCLNSHRENDSGLASSITIDTTEDDSGESKSFSDVKTIKEIFPQKLKGIFVPNKIPSDSDVISKDTCRSFKPENCKQTVKYSANETETIQISSTSQNAEESPEIINTETLKAGVYSNANNFVIAGEPRALRTSRPKNNIDLRNKSVQRQLAGQTNELPSVFFNVGENSCTVEVNKMSANFLNNKHYRLDCNCNDFPSSNIAATNGYSSKEAFMLPFENVC